LLRSLKALGLLLLIGSWVVIGLVTVQVSSIENSMEIYTWCFWVMFIGLFMYAGSAVLRDMEADVREARRINKLMKEKE